ncbi:MAG: SAM-dependent methyltransferase, partial [Tepidimonas sp.]|uniref:class I SAM-dependent methyltransferase n=1 Tax=Tepidimonas sp. TaxID=2002775 RepID=UPI00298F0AFB
MKRSSAPELPADVLAELRPGQSLQLLQELHILTRDGRLNQDSRRKLKQVLHLLHFIEPLLEEALAARGDITVVDHGAGKSYLGFLLYDRVLSARPLGTVWGVEARVELVERAQDLARRLGFARMHFVAATVREAMATLPTHVDVVTALHACDTATDDAIDFALQRQARALVVVPCCQAEVAAVLRRSKALQLARTPLAELWRHPLHTREFGSQVTNVLRCLRLQASGYDVTVTELVGWEHSLKNELILARRTGRRQRSAALRLQRILDDLGLA